MTALSEALRLLRDAHRGVTAAECALDSAATLLASTQEAAIAADVRADLLRALEALERLFGRVSLAMPTAPALDLEDQEARTEALLPRPAEIMRCDVCGDALGCGVSHMRCVAQAIAPVRGAQ